MTTAPGAAGYSLLQLDAAPLREIADGLVPQALAHRTADGALPPHFVAARSLRLVAQGKAERWCHAFLIVRDADLRIVGACGFKDAPCAGRVEIGYGVAPAHRRQGAASAAVAALVERAFAAGVAEVLAEVVPENLASAAVVRGLGFQAIGSRVDDEGENVVQWLAARGTSPGGP